MTPQHHSHALAAAVSCVVAATALLTPSAFADTAAAPLAASAELTGPYGVCAHLHRVSNPAERAEECGLVAAAGITRVRFDMEWWRIQKKPGGPFDFSHYDAVIGDAEAHGLTPLPILFDIPKWADPVWEHLDEWGAFVEAVVSHYGDRFPDIEIWNEENHRHFWKHEPSPTNYCATLKTAYEAAKRANPDVRVLFGGTAGVPLGFIEDVYKAGGAPFFDAMNIHPYNHPRQPEGHLDVKIEAVRAIMAKYGDADKPLVITELGWPTHDASILGVNAVLAGLKVARPELKAWRVVYAVTTSGQRQEADAIGAALPPGSTCEACGGARLRERLAAGDVDAVFYPFDETFPIDTFEEVLAFVEAGGVLVDAGGMPMWNPVREIAPGVFVGGGSGKTGRSADDCRAALGIDVSAWWMDSALTNAYVKANPTDAALAAGFQGDPTGENADRFQTPRRLGPDDEFIPLLVAKDANGRDAVAASVIRRDEGRHGCVVVSGLRPLGSASTNSEENQARYLVRSMAIAFAEGVGQFYWYEFRGREIDPHHSEHHFGLTHRDFSPKPALGAYSNFISIRPAGSVQTPDPWHDEDRAFFFPQWIRPDGTRAGVLWTTGEAEKRELHFPSDPSQRDGALSPVIRFRDYAGRTMAPARTSDGAYVVPVSGSPVFFEGGALQDCTSERDSLLSENAIREITVHDELLAKWLEAQRRITDNLADAIGKDPLRADSMLGDYQFLLSQYRAEIGHYRDFPAFDKTKALNVREFGAAGDGIADDGPAIRKAIAAATAVAGSGRVVFIPKGKYKIGYDSNQPGSNLRFKNIDHLLVYGEDDTDIHIPQPLAVAVSMSDSNDVRLENLNFVFTKRPFTTGVVQKRLSDDTLRCKIDDGMTDPTDGMFRECQTKGLMRFYSPELVPGSKRPARSSILPHQGAPEVTKVADGIYDFKMRSFLPLSEEHAPGVRFAFYARTFGNHAFSVMNCTRPRFVNIRLNSSSAMAFCFINTERPFVAGCKVEADPDTFVSTSADGIYLRGGALGGLLYGNAIRHIGDDFINIHSLLSPALDGSGKRLILKKQWPKQYLKTGARIGLISVSQGINEPTIEGRIAMLAENEDGYEVNLDVSFGNLVTQTSRLAGEGIPKADFLVLPDELCHGLVIQGNRFEHGLSRILAGGRNCLFTGNTVEDSLQHSYFMNICPEPGGQENAEFALPRNIEISRNTFGTLAKTLFNGGTSFNQFRPINPERPTASHIKITDNVIQVRSSSAQPLFNMEHTAFLTVAGNAIASEPPGEPKQ